MNILVNTETTWSVSAFATNFTNEGDAFVIVYVVSIQILNGFEGLVTMSNFTFKVIDSLSFSNSINS